MSDSRPYISVIIPTYNRSDFIVAAIESVLGQKNSKWSYEVIVVDDGSTDNTAEILKAYKNKVSYFKIKHSGLPAVARNFGISKARGELIAFQDSDDLWAEDKFALQVPVFDDPKVVLSYGQAKAMDDKGNKLGKKVVDPKKLKAGENFNTLIKENVISTLTTMVRRSALAEVGNFNEAESLRAVEDYELWMRIANAFPGSIHSLKNTLASYRVHSQNISSANALLSIERLLAVYGVLWEIQSLSDSIRQALEQQIDTMNENWSRQQNIDTPPPAISVVMGIYNDRAYVKQAIESILKQSFKEFEFIIIDDGSSDGSYEVAASFKDPRIRIIRQINHGLVNALNKGVHLARANLIARQDADDISLPKRFEKELELINSNEHLGVVGTFFKYVDEETLEPTGITITSPTKPIDLARNLYFNNPIGHGTALIRKQAIVDAGGYSDKYGPNEDYYLWHKIVAAGWQIAVVPDVYYLYRLSSQSISRTKEELQHKLFAKLVNDIWEGPIYSKPFWRIVADNNYYKKLHSPYHGIICGQYKSHQIKLTFELLLRGHLLSGYNNFVGSFLLYPLGAIRLTPTLLWAPIKYIKEHR
jgi:glycosyltransferase involved in cell wall biosynthesis